MTVHLEPARRTAVVTVCCVVVLSTQQIGLAAEIEAQLSPVADTGLYEVSPTNNLGHVAEVPAGVHGCARRSRFLLRFAPESTLPSDAEIVSAELTLQVTAANSGAVTYGLHRMLTHWTEGDKGGNNGAPATAGETTWLARAHPDQLWTAPGGATGIDYLSATSLVQVFDGSHTNVSLSSPGMVADVQRWLDDPDNNFGWMLKALDESVSQTARRIVSREGTTNAPVLTVRYWPGPRLTISNSTNSLISIAFQARPGRAYIVDSRTSLSDGTWQLFTNVAALPVATTHTFHAAATAPHQLYRVRTSAP